jgi:hypothetical protein
VEANGRDLIEFWAWSAKQGLMNANTAGGLRGACREVLQAVAGDDGWEDVDLTQIDIEDYAQRFERLRMAKYKPQSLGVYKARFRNGVSMYLDYLSNPSGWRYTAERPAAARKKPQAAKGQSSSSTPSAGSSSRTGPVANDSPSVTLIEYPFPLRPDCLVKVSLPEDMTAREADRLGAFLKTLAYEAPREIAAVSSAVNQAS